MTKKILLLSLVFCAVVGVGTFILPSDVSADVQCDQSTFTVSPTFGQVYEEKPIQFNIQGNVESGCKIKLTFDRSSLPSGQGSLYFKRTTSTTTKVSLIDLTPSNPNAFFFVERYNLPIGTQYPVNLNGLNINTTSGLDFNTVVRPISFIFSSSTPTPQTFVQIGHVISMSIPTPANPTSWAQSYGCTAYGRQKTSPTSPSVGLSCSKFFLNTNDITISPGGDFNVSLGPGVHPTSFSISVDSGTNPGVYTVRAKTHIGSWSTGPSPLHIGEIPNDILFTFSVGSIFRVEPSEGEYTSNFFLSGSSGSVRAMFNDANVSGRLNASSYPKLTVSIPPRAYTDPYFFTLTTPQRVTISGEDRVGFQTSNFDSIFLQHYLASRNTCDDSVPILFTYEYMESGYLNSISAPYDVGFSYRPCATIFPREQTIDSKQGSKAEFQITPYSTPADDFIQVKEVYKVVDVVNGNNLELTSNLSLRTFYDDQVWKVELRSGNQVHSGDIYAVKIVYRLHQTSGGIDKVVDGTLFGILRAVGTGTSNAITISGDPTLSVSVGQLGSKPYTANVTGSLQGNVGWSVGNVPPIFGTYGIGIYSDPSSGNTTNLKVDARTPSQSIPSSGIRGTVELRAEDSADADPYATTSVLVSIDATSTPSGPNFTLNVLPPPPEIVITRPTSGSVASTTLIYINGFSGFNAGLPTYANSAQFTLPTIRLQDGPDRSPSPSFGGWLISGTNTVFAGIGTFTVSPMTQLGTSTYMVRVTGTGSNGATITKEVSVPVRVIAGPGGGSVADFALNPPNPNPLIIVRPTSGTLASSSSVLANNFTGFNPSVPNSNLVNCTSRLSQLTASLIESPVGAVLPTPSPGAWSGGGGSGGLSSSCTSVMAFSVRSNTTSGIYTYMLSTVGTPPSGSALSKNTTQTVIVVPQGVSDVLSILPPRQTLVRPPAGSVSETMFNAVVSRVSGGYATTNYKPYSVVSPQYQGITVNPNYIYPDFPPSSGIEGPSGINFQDGSTTNPSFLYETDLRGGVTWTHTQTGLGDISYRLIQNGSQATVQFDRDQGISSVIYGELTLTARTGSGISRSVQIPVTVSPIGQQLNPIFVSITSSVPTTTRIIDIRSTVNPALQSSFSLSILATSTTPTSTLPQCNDGIDNDDPEDSDADRADPGCHTDFNPNNSASYDPNDNDERNTPSYTLRILPPKDIIATNTIPTSVSFPIRIQRQQGFTGSVQLLFQSSGGPLPTGVTYSFSPATLNSSQTNSTLTITAASNTILSAAQRQILFTVRGESSLTNEGSDSGSVTFAYSNDGCGCTYTSGVRFRDGKINLGWNCNDIDPTDSIQLWRSYATYVAPPNVTTWDPESQISLTQNQTSLSDNGPVINAAKSVRYQLKCVQGNGVIPPTANPNRDIIRKVFAPFGATILEQ